MNALFASMMLVSAAVVIADQATIRIMPVARTVESTTISLAIPIPKNGQIVAGNPVWIQLRVDGFALGAASSQFNRASEVALSKMGQTVHVVIDNMPYFPINEPALDPFDEGGYYYDMSYKFEIPYRLKEGMHTIRAFPARSFGESLKGEKTFYALNFYVGSEKNNSHVDLSGPYITYNEPSNQIYLEEDKPILFDFYVCNADLSSDGYKVRLSIDGKIAWTATSWQPFYIYGLKKGKHTARLELIDAENKLVSGSFNDVQQHFTVH